MAAHDERAHDDLDRILYKVEDGWHLLHGADLEDLVSTPWLRDQGRAGTKARELVQAAIQRSAYPTKPHRRRIRVTPSPQQDGELTPKHAARLSEQPLVILVENRFDDGAFVRRIVAEFDRSFNKYLSTSTAPVTFDSVGGKGQMQREVEARCQQGPRPRLVVVVDSDRRAPSDPPSPEATRLHGACSRRGIPCWVLAKREAENYLPKMLLDAHRNTGSEHRRRVDAWAKLNEDQKDFYDMKEGLSGGPTEAERALFDDLPSGQRATLGSGFGSKISQCWRHYPANARDELRVRGRGDLELGLEFIRQEI